MGPLAGRTEVPPELNWSHPCCRGAGSKQRKVRVSVKVIWLAVPKPDPNLAGPSAAFLPSLLSREF